MQLKDFILQNANVLLISPKIKDYMEIQKYGFRHIQFFSSVEKASCHFDTIADLEKYDVIMERSISYKKSGRQSFYYMLWEFNRKKHIFIDLWKDKSQNDWCIVNNKKDEFISYDVLFDAVISSVEKSRECLQSIMLHTLPKRKKEMKVLVVGKTLDDWKKEGDYLDIFISYFQSENFSTQEFIKEALKYDILLVEKTTWEKFIAMNYNLIKKIQEKNSNFRVFATFQSFLQSENFEEEKFSTIVGEKIQLNYIISDFRNNLDFLREEYLVSEENGITKQNSILSVICNLYRKKLFEKQTIELNFDFMRAEEFNRLYYLHFQKILIEWKKAVSSVTDFIHFRNLLLESFSNHKFFSIPKDGNGLRILETKDKNGFVVENYAEGILRGTIIISKMPCENEEVWVQLINARGNLNPPIKVGIYPTFYKITKNMLPRIEDFPKERAMYENILKKANRMFAEEKEIKPKETYQRNRYRKKKS